MSKTLNNLNINELTLKTLKQASIPGKILIATTILGLMVLKIVQVFIDAFGEFLKLAFSKYEKSVKDEYVMITGSAGYLAKNLAIEFAKRGAKLILVDRNEALNKTTAEELKAMGYQNDLHCFTTDLCNEQEVRQVCREIKSQFGNLAIVLMAAAPPLLPKSILDTTYAEDIERHFTLGYLSQLWLYQEFLPNMCKAKKGHFVTVSSSSAIVDVPFLSSYAMGKTSQAKLIETVREEIVVNHIEGVNTTCIFMQLLKGGVAHGFEGLIEFDPKAAITGKFAASHIVSGVLNNRSVVFVPDHLRLWSVIKYLFSPRLEGFIVAFTSKINEKLLKLKQI